MEVKKNIQNCCYILKEVRLFKMYIQLDKERPELKKKRVTLQGWFQLSKWLGFLSEIIPTTALDHKSLRFRLILLILQFPYLPLFTLYTKSLPFVNIQICQIYPHILCPFPLQTFRFYICFIYSKRPAFIQILKQCCNASLSFQSPRLSHTLMTLSPS